MNYKKKSKHVFLSSMLLLSMFSTLFLLWYGLGKDSSAKSFALLNKRAHPFELTAIAGPNAGSRISLADFSGEVLIMNFWSSWCQTCAQEAKHIEGFWREYKDKGLKVLGVAVYDSKQAAIDATLEVGKSFSVVLDEEGHTAIDYGVTGVPETIFIDQYGIVRHKQVGPMNRALLEEIFFRIRDAGIDKSKSS